RGKRSELQYVHHAGPIDRGYAVFERLSVVLVSTDGRKNGAAVPGRLRIGMDDMRPLLPDNAAGRLRLRSRAEYALEDGRTVNSACGFDACRLLVSADSFRCDWGESGVGTAGLVASSTLACGHRRSVSRRLDNCSIVTELARGYAHTTREGPVLPL